MPKYNASQNWFRLAALICAFAVGPALAATYPVCPLLPVSPGGRPEIHLYRDIESCRMFLWTEPFVPTWRESGLAEAEWLIDHGYTVIFIDQLLAGTKLAVIEYLNTGLGHYFLAAPDEADTIERGGAGPNWVRTGYGFTVRSIAQLSEFGSPLSQPVYRFYGSVWPGPNSHFFTMNGMEYLVLKNLASRTPPEQPRWNYEGSPFNAFPLVFGAGTCASDRRPVWRAFNDGPQRGIESNPRFSTDKGVIEGMVRQGWIMEGIAFCVDVAG